MSIRQVLAKPKGRGFQLLPLDRMKEIASLGGRAAHASGHAHEFDSAEAKAASEKKNRRQSDTGSQLKEISMTRPFVSQPVQYHSGPGTSGATAIVDVVKSSTVVDAIKYTGVSTQWLKEINIKYVEVGETPPATGEYVQGLDLS